jgi:ribosomal protein S18 acetylase RimI-like enzyme
VTERGRPPHARPTETVVELARSADAESVARLHMQILSEAFLSSLGVKFLIRLYRGMIASDQAVLLVARDGDEVVGFASGAVSPSAFWKGFRRRYFVPVAAHLAARAVRPSTVRRILEIARHLRGEASLGPELLAIGVGPPARRMGLGSRLVTRMEQELQRRGAQQLAVAVRAGNRQARDFFQRLGFHPLGGLEVHQGKPSLRYEKPL